MARPYRVKLYDKAGTLETQFSQIDIEIRSFTKTLNKPGKALFRLPKDAAQATKTNFQKYKRIKFFRFSEDENKYVAQWSGYIERVDEIEERFDVGCIGLLQIFDKRLTTDGQSISGNGGTEALDLLDQTNGDDDTGIIRGTSDYTEAIDMVVDRKTILDVWEDIAKAEDGEYEIDTDTDTLSFKKQIGSDKSSTIRLVFNEERPNENTLDFAKIREDGKQIFNKVIGYGKTSGGTKITSVKSDLASIATYGLLETTETFDNAETQTQLDDLTQGFLDQFKQEIDNPEVRALQLETITNIKGEDKTVGLDLDDIEVGDIVSIVFKTGYNDVEETRRIVEIAVTLDSGGNEDIKLKLNKLDQKLEQVTVEDEQDKSRSTLRKERDAARRFYRI